MGCTQPFRRQEINGNVRKFDLNDSKNFSYANKEFDVSETENEDEIFAVKTRQPETKPTIFRKMSQSPAIHSTQDNRLTSTSSTTTMTMRHTLLDNRYNQTSV